MNGRRIELFYYPVFKGFKIPTKEDLQQKIANYLTHHPELRPHQKEPWHCTRSFTWFQPGGGRLLFHCGTSTPERTWAYRWYRLLFKH